MDRRIPHETDLPHVILVVAASTFLILSMASCDSNDSDDTMMDDVEIATATKESSPTKAVTATHTPQPLPSATATTKPTNTALPSATPTTAPTLTATSLPADTPTTVPATVALAPTREPTKVPTEALTESPTEQSAVAASEVQIISIFYDGVVSRSEPDEYCEIANLGGTAQSLNGWYLNAGNPGQDYWFGDYTLEAGQHCRVYTNENHAEWGTLSFGCGTAIWKNSSDCGYLYDASGQLVSSWCY